jgi:tripartite-type tricarboxylate transporter receptor subunit TctC
MPGENAMLSILKPRAACGVIATCLLALASLIGPADAQANYPDRPIKVIVPFPAGGGGDTLARTVLNKVAEQQGWNLVIENHAGAGGNIGVGMGSRAEPDGYTLTYGTNGTHGINQTLYKNPGFDAVKDFEPISRFTQIGLILAVHPSVPAKTVKELIDHLKANPGKVNYATSGNGTTSHLAGAMFKLATGTDFVQVPFRGGALAMTDMISGRMQVMIEVMPSALPQVQGGKLRGLAVTTEKRWVLAPDIKTMEEAGVKNFVITAWDGVFAPAGTPKPIVAKLNAAVQKALADPKTIETLAKRGAAPVASTPDEFRSFIASEVKRWGKLVKESGATIN